MSTIAHEIMRNGRRVPDGEALVFSDRRYTWSQVAAATESRGRALRELGLTPGDRCAILGGNSDDFLMAAHAILWAGGVVVPLNERLALPELAFILADSAASLLLYDERRAEVAAELARTGSLHLTSVVLRTPGTDDEDLIALGESVTEAEADGGVPVTESDNAIILYTSGTTGSPKGVLMDHRRLFYAALSQLPVCGLWAGERFLHVAPLYHGAGITIANAATIVGGTNVILPGFDPADVLATIEAEHINVMLGVPTMFQLLLRHPERADHDLSSWRVGIFGAAPMPETAVKAMLEALPNVALVQQCGQTEAGPCGLYQTAQQVIVRPDASGFQAMPFLEVRVLDAHGHEVEPGQTGEMQFRGESVMKEYWRRPSETRKVLAEDGWLATGDIVRVDADGAMTIVDRLKDMIISGGRNVYSVEVESAVAAHPGVRDCAVLGRPDPVWGESIVAVVDLDDDATVTLTEIRDTARALIADYKLPHDLVIAPIPRNASGKILKQRIREELFGRTSPGGG